MINIRVPFSLCVGLLAHLCGLPLFYAGGVALIFEFISLNQIYLTARYSGTKIKAKSFTGYLLWQYTTTEDIRFEDITTIGIARMVSYLLLISGTVLPYVGAAILLASMLFYSRVLV
jgi:hypothetical protein